MGCMTWTTEEMYNTLIKEYRFRHIEEDNIQPVDPEALRDVGRQGQEPTMVSNDHKSRNGREGVYILHCY